VIPSILCLGLWGLPGVFWKSYGCLLIICIFFALFSANVLNGDTALINPSHEIPAKKGCFFNSA
jgi:hypothetical protein